MSITTALSARRDALRDREAGFTLIELLVVVLIIGILAAIAIPVYLGVQNNAKDTAVKSDLVNEKTSLIAVSANNSGAAITGVTLNAVTSSPVTATATLTGVTGAQDLVALGFSRSSQELTNPVFIAGTGTAAGKWCIAAKSVTNNIFSITSGGSVTAVSGTNQTCTPA